MAVCILRFPNGCGCRNWVIAQVSCDDNGVVCFDSNNNLVGRVDTTNPAAQLAVSQAIMDCLDAGKGFKQPDFAKIIHEAITANV